MRSYPPAFQPCLLMVLVVLEGEAEAPRGVRPGGRRKWFSITVWRCSETGTQGVSLEGLQVPEPAQVSALMACSGQGTRARKPTSLTRVKERRAGNRVTQRINTMWRISRALSAASGPQHLRGPSLRLRLLPAPERPFPPSQASEAAAPGTAPLTSDSPRSRPG